MASTLVGVGGGGINIAQGMVEHGFACDHLLLIGRDPRMQELPGDQSLTLDLSPEGVVSAQEVVRSIRGMSRLKTMLKKMDLMILMVGLGGQTGGFAAPVLVSEALATGIDILVIACHPFAFESDARHMYAQGQLAELQRLTPNVLHIPNDLLVPLSKGLSIETSFDSLNAALAMFVNQIIPGK